MYVYISYVNVLIDTFAVEIIIFLHELCHFYRHRDLCVSLYVYVCLECK